MAETYETSDLLHGWLTKANMRVYYNAGNTRICDLRGLPCWEVRMTDDGYEVHYSLHEEDDFWIATFSQVPDLEKFLAVTVCGRVRLGMGLPTLRLPLTREQGDPAFDLRNTRDKVQVMYRRAVRAVFPGGSSVSGASQFTHYAELPLDELIDDLASDESMFDSEIDDTEPVNA